MCLGFSLKGISCSMKSYRLSELTSLEVDSLKARPRIDFSSIFSTVSHHFLLMIPESLLQVPKIHVFSFVFMDEAVITFTWYGVSGQPHCWRCSQKRWCCSERVGGSLYFLISIWLIFCFCPLCHLFYWSLFVSQGIE